MVCICNMKKTSINEVDEGLNMVCNHKQHSLKHELTNRSQNNFIKKNRRETSSSISSKPLSSIIDEYIHTVEKNNHLNMVCHTLDLNLVQLSKVHQVDASVLSKERGRIDIEIPLHNLIHTEKKKKKSFKKKLQTLSMKKGENDPT